MGTKRGMNFNSGGVIASAGFLALAFLRRGADELGSGGSARLPLCGVIGVLFIATLGGENGVLGVRFMGDAVGAGEGGSGFERARANWFFGGSGGTGGIWSWLLRAELI